MTYPPVIFTGIWPCFFIAALRMPQEVSAKVKNGLMTLQTGESKNGGGKIMADRWAQFRFVGDGQTPSWAVSEDHHWWVLTLEGAGCLPGRVKIDVMPSRHDGELAIDASLEFLDRLRERRVPKFIECPDALMALCVKAAIRQR